MKFSSHPALLAGSGEELSSLMAIRSGCLHMESQEITFLFYWLKVWDHVLLWNACKWWRRPWLVHRWRSVINIVCSNCEWVWAKAGKRRDPGIHVFWVKMWNCLLNRCPTISDILWITVISVIRKKNQGFFGCISSDLGGNLFFSTCR